MAFSHGECSNCGAPSAPQLLTGDRKLLEGEK